ncbi:MAG: DeoR/GlpR transcriptional regulator [Lachnospiraceae bacterium]|nr:DeoR/GlpR transcriptional regulator [Lachnospiraceae bacterium]
MEKRRQQIVDLVNQQNEISFAVLKEHFPDVSEVTLRKDLRYLDEEQLLIRVHGGAKSVHTAVPYLSDYYIRFTQHVEAKEIIAQKVAKMLKPHDTLFLASGSTCGMVAKMLPNIPLRVFTDGMEVAINLAKVSNVEVHIVGGQIESGTMRVVGGGVLMELNKIRFDYAICGTAAYSPKTGFSCDSSHKQLLNEVLRKRADKMLILMDQSKERLSRAGWFYPVSEVDMVIGDGKLSDETVRSFQAQGVEVH